MDSSGNIYINIPFTLIESRLDSIEELSIGVEIYLENGLFDGPFSQSIYELSSELERRGIERTVHGPYLDISLGAHDRKVRGISVERLKGALGAARVLSAKTVVIHTGYDERLYGDDRKGWVERCKESLFGILQETDGVRLLLENVFETDPCIFEDVFSSFPEMGFCFDTGHFNVFSRVPLRVWISSLGGRIGEVHLHDNLGYSDDHLPCGMGNFPFLSLMDLLRVEDVLFTVEVLSERHALEAIERGRRTVLRWRTG